MLVVVTVTSAATHAAPPAKSVFLNGVNIDGVVNQRFDNATVVIDDKGNVVISVKGYEVKTVQDSAPPAAPQPVSKRYFLVGESSGVGLAQYDIDVFVNAVWVRRIMSTDAQSVVEISKYMKKGNNAVHFAATKNLGEARRSASPQHFLKVYVGEGNMGGNNVMIDNALIEYKRDASEMGNFANDYTVEGR